MSKSRLVVTFSLVFLLANFISLHYFPVDAGAVLKDGQTYDLKAQVVGLDKRLKGWQIIVRPLEADSIPGKILVYTSLYPEHDYGEIWRLKCRLDKPEPIVGQDQRVFFYDQYLAKDKIYAICYRPQIQIIGQEKYWAYYFYRAKSYLWTNLNIYLVEPASSLAKALLLSSRRETPAEINNIFARVGLSHVIAISGMHLVIIAWLLETFFIALGLSRKSVVWLVLGIILVYLYLTGLPGSGIRATLMIGLILIGRSLGRYSSAFYSLLLSAAILVAINPYILLYDIGWQLSFLAVLGLLCYVRFFNRILFFVPEVFKIREVLAVTLAAQVFTTPLILYYFGIFSLVAPLANFIILPISTLVLVLSLILGLVGFWPLLAQILAWPLFICFKIMVLTAAVLADLPGAYIRINYFPWTYLLAALVAVAILTLLFKPYKYE